jgi:Right handed beta helix region
MGREYFVSVDGDDNGPGSLAMPWRTLSKVNSTPLAGGDKIYLAGGQDHRGSIVVGGGAARVTGSGASIEITSTGTKRARVLSGAHGGLLIWNKGGVAVSNIDFVGDGSPINATSGICLAADGGRDILYGSVIVKDVDISGYGCAGLAIGSRGSGGFSDVRIENAALHHNAYAGLLTWGSKSYSHRNIVIRRTTAGFNHGIPGLLHPSGHGIHSGHGILLTSVDGALVEECTAHDNGAGNIAHKSGPAGIWVSESRNVTIRNCLSFRNRTASSTDGGGSGLDGGVSNSSLENNTSHDNDGPGFLLAQYAEAAHSFRDNRVVGNTSLRDCRRNDNGAIHLWGPEESPLEQILIKGNRVDLGPGTEGRPRALFIDGRTRGLSILENTFDGPFSPILLQIGPNQSSFVFRDNSLSTQKGFILWQGQIYKEISGWQEPAPV